MFAALLLALLPQDEAALDAHLRNVHLERREAFLEAWDTADEARRELIRKLFRSRRGTGVPATYQVSSQFLTENRRVLEGAVDASHELSWSERFACSLDLLVLPGAFGAGDQGRGNEVIVRVLPVTTRLFEPIPEQVALRLVWVGPDGQEIPARQEPVHRSAFRMPGFEMYLRAPASRPGRWSLAPEIERDGEVGRGTLVPVDCIQDLFGRVDRLALESAPDPRAAAARAALARHLEHGLRDGMAPTIGELLDGAHLPPLLNVGEEWAGGRTLVLDGGPEDLRHVMLVVAPALEEPDWVFGGPALEAWTLFATRTRSRVYSTALPIRNPAGPDVLALLAGLERIHPDLPITLLVRGPAVGRLALAMSGRTEALPFDRVVVNTVPSPKARSRKLFDVPTLLLTPLFEARPLEQVEVDGPSLFVLRTPDPPLVVDRVMPLHLEAWMSALDELER